MIFAFCNRTVQEQTPQTPPEPGFVSELQHGEAQALRTFSAGHIQHLAVEPGSHRVASASAEGRVCVLDLWLNRPLRCIQVVEVADVADPKKRTVTRLQYVGLSPQLIVGLSTGSVQVYRPDGERVDPPCMFQEDGASLGTNIMAVWSVAEGLGATAGRNGASRFCEYGLAKGSAQGSGEKPKPLPALADFPGSLFDRAAVDEKGELIAVGKGELLGVWLLQSGAKLWMEPKIGSRLEALALSGSGARLVTGHTDGTVRLWSPRSGGPQLLPQQFKHGVAQVALSEDGRRVAVSSKVGELAVIDTRTFERVLTQRHQKSIDALAFLPDGRLAAASEDIGVRVWDVEANAESLTLGAGVHPIQAAAYAPGQPAGRALLATASDDGKVRLWKQQKGHITDAEWSLACALEGTAGRARAVAFLPPDGEWLAAVGDDRLVHLWKSSDCSAAGTLGSDRDINWGRTVAFGPDGKTLAMGSLSGSVRVWTGQEGHWENPRDHRTHSDEVSALAWVPGEGQLLVTGSKDRTVVLLETRTGQKLLTFPARPQGVASLSVSSDGKRLAVAAGKEVLLWSLALPDAVKPQEPPKPQATLAHQEDVLSVQFSPDGRELFARTKSGDVAIWDATEGRPLRKLDGKRAGDGEGPLGLAISPDGAMVALPSLGRVDLRRTADLGLAAQLWQGQQDWAVFLPDETGVSGKLFRQDLGRLLWTSTPTGELQRLLPPVPKPGQEPTLTLSYHFDASPAGGQQRLGDLVLQVRNIGPSPAYWVEVEPVDDPERLDLKREIHLKRPDNTVMQIAPNKEAVLRLSIWDRKKRIVPLMEARFCVFLRHAHSGSPELVCSSSLSQGLWPIRLPLISPMWRGLLLILPFGLLGLLGGLLWRTYRRARSHPAVRHIEQGQSPLQDSAWSELLEIGRAVSRAGWAPSFRQKRRQAFAAAGLDENGFRRLMGAARSAQDCASALAESLSSQTTTGVTLRLQRPELAVFSLALPPLSLHVPKEVSLIVVTTQAMTPQQALCQCRVDLQNLGTLAIVLDLTGTKQTRSEAKEALDSGLGGSTFVVVSETELVALLLSRDEQKAKESLRRLLIAQCPLRDLLPYRDGGNEISVEESSFFFGRHAELRKLLHVRQRHFLLVGPRSMGKSSLLNALRRQLSQRFPRSRVVKAQLFDDSLAALRGIEPALEVSTPESFYQSVMRHPSEHLIFLLDEADPLVAADTLRHGALTSVMRALGGQGKASFVLAGHQALHRATSEPGHPLRNFGEVLRLGPLDLEAAQQMIVEPLTALGLRFAQEAEAVHFLRTQTGCRPHLLARLCVAICLLPQSFGPTALTLAELQQTAQSREFLFESFGRDWTVMAPLERALVRLALLQPGSRREDLIASLHNQGIPISAQQLEECLDHLYAWHYALIPDEEGRLYCPVPLLSFWLTDLCPELTGGHRFSSAEQRLRRDFTSDLLAHKSQPVSPVHSLLPPSAVDT